ncbi:substrate-binding domain-containing protein [Spartinivicinus poritis]|uniref:Substrate-binding domain-containing protein n=1 Tax=Spartinivicinus poritis TaxID=2994640 RepID=A0ABT5UF94_9GAMM|nr:substrate-binding domain-containing protein [Spartinivicinus sp. A2-2]MDE1465050.1 substrate-binding domain-containing protein [Spartinivicinus sp. A2-2]
MRNLFINPFALFLMCTFSIHILAKDTISITGCGISKKAYMEKIASIYEKKSGIKIRLSGGGATKGLRLTSQGRTDIGASCRHRIASENGIVNEESNLDLVQVGWDALVVMVNKNQKVDNLTIQNLRDIFDGKVTSWNELGGTEIDILPLTRKGKLSGVGYMARLLIFADPTYEFKNKGNRYKSTGPLEKATMSHEGAIAINGISSAKKIDVKFIGIDGFVPTKENIMKGNYPFFRPLYIAIQKNNADLEIKKLVQFILSEEGQKIISDEGTVNLKEGLALADKWLEKVKKMGNAWQEDEGLIITSTTQKAI